MIPCDKTISRPKGTIQERGTGLTAALRLAEATGNYDPHRLYLRTRTVLVYTSRGNSSVFFTLNRSFTRRDPAHPVSALILHANEIRYKLCGHKLRATQREYIATRYEL